MYKPTNLNTISHFLKLISYFATYLSGMEWKSGKRGRFLYIKFALNAFNPSFKVRNIDNTVGVCRIIRLDIAPPAQGLDTQPVHARATTGPGNGLRWHSS